MRISDWSSDVCSSDLQAIEARILDRRPVTDSGGHVGERIFIDTRMQLGGLAFDAEINLTSRRTMRFPMLLGRTALANRFVVDPSRSFVLGEPPGEDSTRSEEHTSELQSLMRIS